MRTFPMAPLTFPDDTPENFRRALQTKIAGLRDRLRGAGRRVEIDVDQQTVEVSVEIADFAPNRIRTPRVQVRFLIDASQPRWTVIAGFHTESMIRDTTERLWMRSDDADQVQLLEDEVCECIEAIFV